MDETLIRVLYGKPVPTILDTDIGTTYDNHLALIYILSCPSRFKSKTDCLFHNKYDRTRTDRSENIEFFQRFDIPMSLGRASEDTYGIFQYRWSKDYSLEKFQLFALAGSLHFGYNHSSMPSKEYNIEHDISSAQTMFASS
ncbi:unnamed protein product [Rotaria socialis]|uniref:Uncharacterized protein n=1 Tax=Rotaria socialis TaxID=392032 RepID=A0A820XT79_9BILA|nr:unnamed protein product [Rotaria socialis]